MGNRFIDSIHLTNIANALRTKLGTTDTYTPAEMSTAIANIPSGSDSTTGWIDAYLTQDNTQYDVSTSSSTSYVTPNTQWSISGKTASLPSDVTTDNPPTIYMLYNGTKSLVSLGGYDYTLQPTNVYYFTKTLTYRDINNLPRFGAYYYASSTSKYLYRLRPFIYTPTDFNITENTLMDIVLILTAGSSVNKISCTFKYRIYNPVSMAGKTYKDESDNPLTPVASVTLNKNTTNLNEGDTETLVATVLPNNAISREVIWYSSNSDIASVNNGVVTASSGGSANITAASIDDSSKYATCSVNVTASYIDTNVTLSSVSSMSGNITYVQGNKYATYTTVPSGDIYTYVPTSMMPVSKGTVPKDGSGFAYDYMFTGTSSTFYIGTDFMSEAANFTVTSTANSIYSIKSIVSGNNIYLKYQDKTALYQYTDTYHNFESFMADTGMGVFSYDVYNNISSLKYGSTGTQTLSISINDSTVSGYDVSTSLNDLKWNTVTTGVTKIAIAPQYSPNSTVYLPKGCSIQYAVYNNSSDYCRLFVQYVKTGYTPTIEVTGVSVSPSTVSILTDSTTTLTATVTPSNATNKNLTWSSSDTNKATVNNGVVTGISDGNVTITATSVSKPSISGSSTVTVASPKAVTNITVTPSTASVNAGETTTLTAIVSPDDATDKRVNWTTSNSGVATVNNGTVAGIGSGTATITATSVSDVSVFGSSEITVSGSVPYIDTNISVTVSSSSGNITYTSGNKYATYTTIPSDTISFFSSGSYGMPESKGTVPKDGTAFTYDYFAANTSSTFYVGTDYMMEAANFTLTGESNSMYSLKAFLDGNNIRLQYKDITSQYIPSSYSNITSNMLADNMGAWTFDTYNNISNAKCYSGANSITSITLDGTSTTYTKSTSLDNLIWHEAGGEVKYITININSGPSTSVYIPKGCTLKFAAYESTTSSDSTRLFVQYKNASDPNWEGITCTTSDSWISATSGLVTYDAPMAGNWTINTGGTSSSDISSEGSYTEFNNITSAVLYYHDPDDDRNGSASFTLSSPTKIKFKGDGKKAHIYKYVGS